MKYAVLGANGQLGRDVCPRLSGEVVPLNRGEIDLARPETIRPRLESVRPDVFVNCAAYNHVDRAEYEPEYAFAVNAQGVGELARACADLRCTLVHFSTDYVFGVDETRPKTPYTEADTPGPVNVYGLSKLAGEHFVRTQCPHHYLVRTCGLYGVWGSGGKGGNFVETMLRLAREGKPVRVVADQTCTPTYTADLAGGVVALLGTGKFGVYHLTSGGECTWHEFAAAIFEIAGVKADLTAITTKEYAAPARRPAYSLLDNAAWRPLGLPALRPWRDALTAYLAARQSRASA